ncbi:MAG: hypothetical protein ACYTFT_00930 [Planctomycetota bacterium]
MKAFKVAALCAALTFGVVAVAPFVVADDAPGQQEAAEVADIDVTITGMV